MKTLNRRGGDFKGKTGKNTGFEAMNISQILSKERLVEILSRVSQVKAGVIGDFALDAYWQVDMRRSRLSRETPHFPRPVVSEDYAPGAGGNVAQNLAGLGVRQVRAFSVLGEDMWGRLLEDKLLERNVGVEGLLNHPKRRTTAYIKPVLMGYDSRQEDARLDFENLLPVDAQAAGKLLDIFEAQLDELDVVLVSDQLDENGIITPHIRQRLVALAQSHPHIGFLADSRQNIALYQGMVLKPNRIEALTAAKPACDPQQASRSDLEEAGQILSRQSRRPVFLTLGAEGVLVCTTEEQRLLAAAPVREPLDVTGAGDTFLAALAACLAAGGSPWEAGAVANLAAAVTVEKIHQTGTASPAEILERLERFDPPP